MAMTEQRRNEIGYLLYRLKCGKEGIKLCDLKRDIGNAHKALKIPREEIEEFVKDFLLSFLQPNPRFVVEDADESSGSE